MKMIKVALVSGVRHAYDYLEVMTAVEGIELVCITEATDAPDWAVQDSRRLAERSGVPFRPMAAALDEVDAVVICSEPTRHAALAVTCLVRGRHVLIDKPPGVTANEFEQVVDLEARRPELVVSTIHRLHSPAIAHARAIIDSGAIGLPLALDFEWLAAGGLDGTTVERPELVCDPQLSGGGELTNFGWYPLLALRYLTGLAVTDVRAFGAALFGGPHQDFDVEDSAVLSLQLEHRVTSTITVARVPAGVAATPITSTARIIGSHGHFTFDENEPSVRTRQAGDAGPRHARIGGSAAAIALRTCFEEFRDAVAFGRPLTVGHEDILQVLRVLDSARLALHQSVAARHGHGPDDLRHTDTPTADGRGQS